MELSLRKIELSEFKSVYKKIKQDFALGEYAPYEVLYQQLKMGIQEGLILLDGEREVAYSICTKAKNNDYVLISLFAVHKEYRGIGYGSAFLKEMMKSYSDKMGIIAEVEKPEHAKTDIEADIRINRIRFYEKAGFCMVPNIDYAIWDVPMHLMVLPQKASSQELFESIGQVMYDLYFALMGKRYIHKMSFEKLVED